MKLLYAFIPALALSPVFAPVEGRTYYNYTEECPKQIKLPKPTGPYSVGTSTFHFINSSQPELGSEDPNDRRQVIFQLWYPATSKAGATPVAYVPELDSLRAGLRSDPGDIPQKLSARLASYGCVKTEAFEDAPVRGGADRYPLIIFSPGGGVSRHWHTIQAQEFASHGYVVAVLSHAYSGLDVFPGIPVLSVERWRPPANAIPEQETALDDAMSDELALDARFALDQIEKIAAGDIAHPLKGRIDLARVAIVGHSRGGKTVARSCSTDTRFKACITYDNLAPNREQASGLRTPQLTIRTEWDPKRVEALHAYMQRNPAAALDVTLANATHFNFTDLQIVDPEHYDHKLDPVAGLALSNRITLKFLDSVWTGKAPDLSSFAKSNDVRTWSKP